MLLIIKIILKLLFVHIQRQKNYCPQEVYRVKQMTVSHLFLIFRLVLQPFSALFHRAKRKKTITKKFNNSVSR